MPQLDHLPIHAAPAPRDRASWRLTIGSPGGQSRSLTMDELEALPAAELTADFACEEGWQVPGLRWQGVSLSALMAAYDVPADASYAAVRGVEFVSVVPVAELLAARAILATRMDGEGLAWEHGGPVRLAMAAGAHYQGVKSVDRIDFTTDPGQNTHPASAPRQIASEA